MTNSTLPDDDGFRIRGAQPTRMDAFVDAAFAFALTILVISIGQVPSSITELMQAMRGIPAFAASFYLIARLWQSHRHWSRRYGIEDNYSTRLGLILVFVVLVYVYPLRMLAALVFAEISGNTLSETRVVIESIDQLRQLYVIFAIGYATAALVFLLLHRHALRSALGAPLSASERIRTRFIVRRWLAFGLVAVISLLLAVMLPMRDGQTWMLSAPGFAYMLIYVVKLVIAGRERAALANAGTDPAT